MLRAKKEIGFRSKFRSLGGLLWLICTLLTSLQSACNSRVPKVFAAEGQANHRNRRLVVVETETPFD